MNFNYNQNSNYSVAILIMDDKSNDSESVDDIIYDHASSPSLHENFAKSEVSQWIWIILL